MLKPASNQYPGESKHLLSFSFGSQRASVLQRDVSVSWRRSRRNPTSRMSERKNTHMHIANVGRSVDDTEL